MWSFKADVTAAWFSIATKSAPAIMTVNTANRWRLNDRFNQADGGRAGVVEAAKWIFFLLNARHRIKEPTD